MAGRKRVSKTSLSARLAAAGERVGLDLIASGTDTKMRTLEGYLRGDTVPDAEFLRKFVGLTGVDPAELLMGERPANENHVDPDTPATSIDRFDLRVSAGHGSAEVAKPVARMLFDQSWLLRHGINPVDVSVLEVSGDSMEPILFDRDLILVDKRKARPISGQMYVVVRPDLVQVKWVLVRRSGITLVSENDGYPPENLDPRDTPEAEFYKVRWFGHFIA